MSSPTSIYEPARVIAWLDTKLSAVATATGAAGAYEGVAPDGVSGHYIVFTFMGGSNVAGVAGIRLWNSSLYLVKIVGPVSGPEGNYAALVATADAVDSALQLAGEETAGPASDGYIMRCVRETELPLPSETINGIQWDSLGALWRIQARKKS